MAWSAFSNDLAGLFEQIRSLSNPTSAIVIFFLTQMAALAFKRSDRRQDLNTIVVGIYEEIRSNIAYNDKFLADDKTLPAVKEKIRANEAETQRTNIAPDYRPLIVITESSQYYDGVIRETPKMTPESLIAVRRYYRTVNDQRLTAAQISSESFLTIEPESRCDLIDDLWKVFGESHETAKKALDVLNDTYPKKWFRALKP